jgi:hypothetical protein
MTLSSMLPFLLTTSIRVWMTQAGVRYMVSVPDISFGLGYHFFTRNLRLGWCGNLHNGHRWSCNCHAIHRGA